MSTTNSTQSNLIGKKAYVKDGSFYEGHWGFIRTYEGDQMYTLSGGTLGDVEPLLHRIEFTVHRQKKERN